MDRIYKPLVLHHLLSYPQMVFLVGPRQVGKTTIAKQIQQEFKESLYLNWDVVEDRQKILSGQRFIEDNFPLKVLRDQKPLIVFDEIHKYKDWKNYLKGFYDLYKDHYHILVTGSARLDLYSSGNDSLMGRYFQYHIHPLSVSETIKRDTYTNESLFLSPHEISDQEFDRLFQYGGFPDVFLKRTPEYQKLWHSTRLKQLFYEDILAISKIQDIGILEVFAELLRSNTGQIFNRSTYSKKLQVGIQTINRWLFVLEKTYYCYRIQPWHKNVMRSLIKEPKIYLWDWSLVADEGQRFENFVASHLLKFGHFWSNQGKGDFNLYYLRNIDKQEVDFLLVKDGAPWMMIEAKLSKQSLSRSLEVFQKQLDALWSFQLVKTMDFSKQDCSKLEGLWQVPAKTLLSQLV